MAGRAPTTSLRTISEINLTPLMDLTFILLITFIITFPLIEQGIPVNLPQGKAESLTSDRAQTITIDRGGRIYLDDVPTSLDELAATVRAAVAGDPQVAIMVRADKENRYGDVVKVLRVLHDAHIARMAIVTEAE